MAVVDLVREAAYWATRRRKRNPTVTAVDVQKAIDQHIYRSSRIEERIREMIIDGTIMVDSRGEVAGQVNGLSVSSMGDYAFGRPSRITATVRLGSGDVIDIEREVEMGGPIHSKGVLILAGYLGARYAADRPLSLSARLVFEQSYSGVDGDSASSAELYAILSALSGLPIRQRFAVTGSVNQRGQVQAIGGVNEKIEGFFKVCKERGLNGDEGVLIPTANVKHLMLRSEVRAGDRSGQVPHPPGVHHRPGHRDTHRRAGGEGSSRCLSSGYGQPSGVRQDLGSGRNRPGVEAFQGRVGATARRDAAAGPPPPGEMPAPAPQPPGGTPRPRHRRRGAGTGGLLSQARGHAAGLGPAVTHRIGDP